MNAAQKRRLQVVGEPLTAVNLRCVRHLEQCRGYAISTKALEEKGDETKAMSILGGMAQYG